uniref:Usherin n=1 Tax=Naja naja TaxID=35670 RepID=A0A8C6X579_NAJNA
MICLVLHCGFLLHAIETSITVYYTILPLASSQGHFPSLENVGAFKNISIVPSEATCGLPERSTFCQSSAVVESINFCIQQFCIQKCPYRSSPASYAAILSEGLGNVIQQDQNDVPPGSFSNTSIIFHGEKGCFSTPHPRKLTVSFTLSVWLKPEKEGVMCIVEKTVHGQTVFKLTISEKETVFYYRTINGLQLPIKVMTLGRILVKKWNHLSVQVSSEQFVGRMQDFRLYQMALTNRDIFEVWSGKIPQLRIQSECRCPGSHPRVHPLVQRYCIPNGADDTTNDRVLRLNPEAHPLSYVNDNDIGTTWISSIFNTTEHLRHGVTITIDLENGQYQVFYVIIQFFSPQPEAIRIQRKKQPSIGWEDWQYFARDCSVFGMENNGSLRYPDSVNCLQVASHPPYSHGNITFSILTPEPNHRPGYNDFYNTPSLQEFVKVSKIKIHLFGQYHTTMPWVNFGHRYYGIDEITISGRCNCFGHADHCDTSHSPYKCLCSEESYTEGNNCDRCQPLYNDKPFHPGDQVHAYNCKPCQCFNHAVSCHYNSAIDYFPNEYYRGGGGVCDNCQHNTSGRNCELCNDFFYRHIDADLSALDVCKPCECYSAGTKNGSFFCNKVGGRCNCKRHVSGRQCNQCQEGFYNLQEFNPDGCSPCSCNASGTVDGDTTCHQNSGQCKCKENVIGLRCDQCKSGYKVIQNIKKDGCEPCLCNIHGSMNNLCNPSTGQCTCKQEVKGLHCDTCIDGFYWMDAFGCKPCSCQVAGSVSDTVCNPKTGQCICKPNFGERQCDDCLNGYYKEWQNNASFCVPCNCDKSGSVNGSLVCDKLTGQCPCKSGVTALQCNRCRPYMYNLTTQNILGCMPCDCDPLGTLPGTSCDQTSGQCICQPHHQGRRCEKCKPGFYISAPSESSCLPCLCHPSGSVSSTCDTLTGQCVCHDSSVSGMKCDHCSDNYFGFNSETGKCQHCNCHPAGAINWTCHPITGQCMCKQFAAGLKCDNCVPNASNLDVHNLFGCSKTPSQQPPPKGQIVNSSAIRVTWNPPDSPNSNWLTYKLYRNGTQISTTEDYHPYSLQVFVDSDLLPYTFYTYYLEASNIHGFTRSTELTYRTQPGIPLGNLHLNPVFPVGPYSISFNWTALSNDTGPIEKYILTCISSFEHQSCGQHESLGTSITVWNLVPFEKYNFYVQACTSGGCLLSQQLSIVTAQAPPEEQLPPVIRNISSTELAVEWVPPRKTNGVIITYELYMKGGIQSNGSHVSPENCVFQSNGWFNLHPVEESIHEKALTPPVTSTVISDLEPFTDYEFRVLSANIAGSTYSNWTLQRTAEAAPVFMPLPSVFPLSPYSLNVSWEKPRDNEARGEVMGYSVNVITEQKVLPMFSQRLYVAEAHEQSFVMTGLEPYRAYYFTITLCNRIGCVDSKPGMGQTLAAAPVQLIAPDTEGINSTVIKITWYEPEELNGPPPVYQLERIDISLVTSAVNVKKGTRFPGNGYYKFPNSTLPTNTYFTGIKISFKTAELDGLLFLSMSPGNQFWENPIKIPITFCSRENDGGRQYNDNNWHHISAIRNQALGTIIIDWQFSATSGSTIIGENTGIFVGGLPQDFIIERKDIVTKAFVGCLCDIFLQKMHHPYEVWESLKWEKAVEQRNVYHNWEGCPTCLEDGAHFLGKGFLELHSNIFHGGMDFEISFMFKTDQVSGLLLFIYNKDGPDYIAVELKSGSLIFLLNNGIVSTHVNLWLGLSYCDGKWNKMILSKRGSVASARMNEWTDHVMEPDLKQLFLNSAVYLGGTPVEIQETFKELGLEQGFGGCMKDVKFTRSAVVNLASVSSSAVRVNLDGCLSTDSAVNCRGNDSILVYQGKEKHVYDNGLQPFTEYLYRVIASNEGGSVSSAWSRSRTRESVPQNVLTLSRIHSINGHSIEVTWDEPVGVKGVIEKYILKASSEDGSNISVVSTEISNTSSCTGLLTGLRPFANYAVTLMACTLAGCTESSHALNISTPQEAPQNVHPPTSVSFPTSLWLSWAPPKVPNGIITQYVLYMDAQQIYTGNETKLIVKENRGGRNHEMKEHRVDGLRRRPRKLNGIKDVEKYVDVYHFLISSPDGMLPPRLSSVTPTSLQVFWSTPVRNNAPGLPRYRLQIRFKNCPENNTELFSKPTIYLHHILEDLQPYTSYELRVIACNEYGDTFSNWTLIDTEEDKPGPIDPPLILEVKARETTISWQPPSRPNGIVTRYNIYQNSHLHATIPGARAKYVASFLQPYTVYRFQVEGCTSKGCSLSSESLFIQTLPDAPEDIPAPELYSDTPTSVLVLWQSPIHPNGPVENFTIERRIKGTEQISTVASFPSNCSKSYLDQSTGLSPWKKYEYRILASTFQGGINSSSWVEVITRPSRPENIQAPKVQALDPYTAQVSWKSPSILNGEILSYEIYMPNPQITITNNLTTSMSHVVTNLIPFTNYSVTIEACTGGGDYIGGCTKSLPTYMVTLPTFPQSINSVIVTPINESVITVYWHPPSKPNGHHIRYELLRRKIQQPLASNPPEDLNLWDNIYSGTQWFYEDKGLSRNTTYAYKLIVRNDVGYMSSEEVIVTTLGGFSEKGTNVTAKPLNHTAIEVKWTTPTLQDVQGSVEYYFLSWNDTVQINSKKVPANKNSAVIGELYPNTQYQILLQVFSGLHSIKSEPVQVTTPDVEPEGLFPPEIVIINSTAVCVILALPSNSNGVVTEYSIYVNNNRFETRMKVPGSFIVEDLSPFTLYDIQVESCRRNICVRSNGTQIRTAEDVPEDLSPPWIYVLGSRSLQINWTSPEQPNGIILGYELFRKAQHPCTEEKQLSKHRSEGTCLLLECNIHENIHGRRCCNPHFKICCNGNQYNTPSFQCCVDKYLSFLLNASCACCGGQRYTVEPEDQCWGNYSTRIFTGKENFLHFSLLAIMYNIFFVSGMFCCRHEYVNMSKIVCCSTFSGETKAHIKKNNSVPLKCCVTELIPESEECCNGLGYNPLKYVCTDRISFRMMMKIKEESKCIPLCPRSTEEVTYCGQCNFDEHTYLCAWIKSSRSYTKNKENKRIYKNLEPHITYEYRLAVWNKHGKGFSEMNNATTNQDVPEGVSPPHWTKVDNREDVIFLTWKEPCQPNGIIIYYIILRNGVEHFRGKELSFMDTSGIQPYQEYSYLLRACTVAGCSDSSTVVTVQGIPENVLPPTIIPLNATTLHLSWVAPNKPNGLIKEYLIHQIGRGLICTGCADQVQHTVTDLQPYENYNFTLTACTFAGCTTSQTTSGRTLQAAPQGVWSQPRHITVSSKIVELYWDEPEKNNGIVIQYRLFCNGEEIFNGGGENMNFTHSAMQPNDRYVYQLEASTWGGSNISEKYIVQTPATTPEEIHIPYNITVISAYSIFVAWNIPGKHINVPLEYNVLLDAGSTSPLVKPVGEPKFILLNGLDPCTKYEIRIQACQNAGCGVGERVYATTVEAFPEDLSPPIISAIGPRYIYVKWLPPKKSNGIIRNYFIYRRPMETQEEILVFIWSEGTLEFIDATDVLQPFTEYEYLVKAQNSKGSVNSSWASTQTLEAPPSGMKAPSAQAISAHSLFLNWTSPISPNGAISQYRVVYQERQNDPTINTQDVTALTVPGEIYQTYLTGLKPYTTYHIHIVAVNNAGQVASPWTSVRTLEASPSGLSNFTVDKKENGRALLLRWAEPSKPNGNIKIYNIFNDGNLEYSGLSRQFLFRRLEPFTEYTLLLEACTAAGCTHSSPQQIWTDAAPPASQMAPVIHLVNSTSIELSWSEPINSNGKIMRYEVIHRHTKENASGENSTTEKENIVFTEYNTGSNAFVYHAQHLQPWTTYEYKIRAWNSAGYTDSPWSAAKTSQAAPEGMAAPTNGILLSYKLQRNDVPYPFSFDASTFNYTDEGLLPYTEYNYVITACTLGGCCSSDHSRIRTLEAAPAIVSPPTLESIHSTQINVSWSPPQIQNGEIIKYILKLNGEEQYVGKSLFKTVVNLQPYTKYDLTLFACTNGGCTVSASQTVWTMEAPPLNLDPPTLLVTDSESLEITWKAPNNPNGKIQIYELRRNGLLVYLGLDKHFKDFMLTPGVEYIYTVTANNSQGSVTSQIAKIRTDPSAPSGMSPPLLHPWTSQTILVIWDPPAKINGNLINYTIILREPIKSQKKVIFLDSLYDSFGRQSYNLTELKPYHRYEVQVQACSLLGCTHSEWSSIQTLEAPPEIQPAPFIDAQSSPDGFQTVLSIVWTGPKYPNGNILHYELYRRQPVPNQHIVSLVYNGSSTSFKDDTLLPFTKYEYQVWSVNSAGRTASNWTKCKTGPAPPQGLTAPLFETVASTSAIVNIRPPLKPNGIITLYRFFSNNTKGKENVLSEGTTAQQTIHGLKPFTTYSIGVEACTCFNCCSQGPMAQITTQPAPPSQQPSPHIQSLTSRNASFLWDAPQEPNGIVRRYELHMYTSCLPWLLPIERVCKPGPIEVRYSGNNRHSSVSDLQPYTAYKLRVVSYNSVGSTTSEWITFTTEKEVPLYNSPFIIIGNLSTIFLDWSHTFLLNGLLKEYVLMEGGQHIYSGFDTRLYLPRTSDKIYLFQVTCITDEGSAVTPVIKYNAATGFGNYFKILLIIGLSDTKIPGPASPLSMHSSGSVSVLQGPSQSQIEDRFSQDSLHQSVSQLIEASEKKSSVQDTVWDAIIHDNNLVIQFIKTTD